MHSEQIQAKLMTAFPIEVEEGSIRGLGIVITPISKHEWTEEAFHFLDAASQQLASSLDYAATIASVTRLPITLLADWCITFISEENGKIHVSGLAHADPDQAELAQALGRYPLEDIPLLSSVMRVLRSGRSELVADIPDSLLATLAPKPEHFQLMRQLGPKSYMAVPLATRGQTLGALLFVAAESGRHYTASDLALAEDLARRAALAVDNARLYHKAQEAVRMRETFLAIASHEIRSPLVTLLVGTQILQAYAEIPGRFTEEDQKILEMIERQAERVKSLTDQLLDLSGIENGQFSLVRQPLDLCALVRGLAEALQPTLKRHTITLSGFDEPLTVNGDELRLEQAMQNLIQNAVKYSPSGGPVSVQLERRRRVVCVSVTDQGIGIPEEALPWLFQPFYRGPNASSSNIKGTGIGLYIVKEIITLHGGTVEVSSHEGAGSTFTFCLPLVEQSESKLPGSYRYRSSLDEVIDEDQVPC